MRIGISDRFQISTPVAIGAAAVAVATVAIAAAAAGAAVTHWQVNRLVKRLSFDLFVEHKKYLLQGYLESEKQLAIIDYMYQLKDLAGPNSQSWTYAEWEGWWHAYAPQDEMAAFLNRHPDHFRHIIHQLTFAHPDLLAQGRASLTATLQETLTQFKQFDLRLIEQALEQLKRPYFELWHTKLI